MTKITNTATDPSNPMPGVETLRHIRKLAPGAIQEQERAGQRELLQSTQLPTDCRGDLEKFLALGFTFGAPSPGDKLFCEATLPPGWKREGSDHDMWSYIVDEKGRRRVSVFYKAAFYDRSAFMGLCSHNYKLVLKGDKGYVGYVSYRKEQPIKYTAVPSEAWDYRTPREDLDKDRMARVLAEPGVRIVYLHQKIDDAWEELIGPKPTGYETEEYEA